MIASRPRPARHAVPRRLVRLGRLSMLAALGAAALLAGSSAACTDVPSDPNTPVSIEFDTLPSPSVVSGDTLRDLLGNVTRLRAVVRNVDGDEIADAPVTFVLPDTFANSGSLKIRVVDGDRVVSDAISPDLLKTPRQVRVIASIGNLQTSPLPLQLVRRPVSLIRARDIGEVLDTAVILTATGADTIRLTSAALGVRVLAAPDTGVPQFRVLYEVTDPAADVADSVVLIRERGGRRSNTERSPVDTTDGSGNAARFVRVYRKASAGATARDTVVVRARVIIRAGQELPPLTFRVPVQASAAAASTSP